MLRDTQGLEVTTNSPEAVGAINQFADQLLGYGNRPEIILSAVEADPTSVLANTHAAALHLFAENGSAASEAEPYLQAARQQLANANQREKLYFSAIESWAQAEVDRALVYHEQLAEQFPRDLVSVQIGQYHYFNLGQSQGLLQLIEKVLPANRENHYIHGMLAFGLEQCHRLDEAEVAGRRATEMNRQDPWAHHAVAHVMETQGRLDEGIAWMESLADTWENCGTFYTHNWWHVALYYLDREDLQSALRVYDRHVWGRACKEYSQCQIDAIALLLRLELRGVEVGNRWQEISAYLSNRLHEHVLPFLDLQYLYALARSGQDEQATEMLKSLQTYAAQAKPYIRPAWAEVAAPMARGLVAHARGDWSTASAEIQTALPRLQEIGGSHAQRDLFEQVYLDTLLRLEHNAQARVMLEKRARTRNQIPAIQRALATTYQKSGLQDAAEQAARRAEELSRR
ncbi:tetratricopeptide repeat protein [Leptolyngbya sp. FACHB-261]|uniref:tetratricopeptide repeat protein n=1 Tax=Leptolyngbya sp. FACHB-261 TaxID=2692806 RepID=UPI0018EFC24A|nr:tetratricopeptide repeat protein [Leptolyngbya sp. FACHB-261]